MASRAAAGWDRFAGTGQPQWAGGGGGFVALRAALCAGRCTALLPLPPGAVEPAGWLRDWAVAAGRGITGHLDEYHAVFRDAWKGTPVTAPAAAADGTGWPLEQCAYWLNGLLDLGIVLHDNALIQKATAAIDVGGQRG